MPTNREEFLDIFGLPRDTSLSLQQIADLSQMPKAALQEVFDRGIGAWKTNLASVRLKRDFSKNPNTSKYPRSARLGKEMWAFARVYSFVLGRDTTFGRADRDVAVKYGLTRF
jgi:hypothetical protein